MKREPLSPAIRAYMAARRRAWRADGRRVCDFPQWREGMTTEQYVRLYEEINHLIPTVA